ncbi:MAG: hypothetical protein ABFE07_02510 [Armatimonadia bacterium]
MTTPTLEAQVTISHDKIREWTEARQGKPARVKDSGDGNGGIVRIDFEDVHEEHLEPISWEEFFEKFEAENLAFLYQDGAQSRFNRMINRD